MNLHLFLFLLSVVIVSFTQILLKTSADRKHATWWREYLNWRVLTAYALFFATTLLVIIAFRGVELKNGPILQSLGYVLVLLLERIFLKARISLQKVIGILLIITGIMIFNLR